MPVNIIIGNVALIAALAFYTIAIWGAFRAKAFSNRHILFMWLGVALDILATLMMAISAGGSLQWDTPANKLHTAVAMVAYLSMGAVASAAPPLKTNDRCRKLITRIAIAPWVLWVGLYVWGMVTRMPKRG
jgi:hypothetical protein